MYFPPDPNDASSEGSFILALRLPIPAVSGSSDDGPGVQQIVLLPSVNTACILSDSAVSFYELPELTPIHTTTRSIICNWIGGLDLNESEEGDPVIMVAMENKIMMVRIGEKPRLVRNIEFPGCLTAVRRETIACVADADVYSLLEVEARQKISLFPISSAPLRMPHERSLSQDIDDRRRRAGTEEELPSSRRAGSVGNAVAAGLDQQQEEKPLPEPPRPSRLRPHILSPTPSEFLLVTGTGETEPGVGMFVNTDGEGVRGTLEFDHYPEALVIDDYKDHSQAQSSNLEQGGYVLAIIRGGDRKYVQSQRWDSNPGEGDRRKDLLALPAAVVDTPVGVRHSVSASQMNFGELCEILRMVRLRTSRTQPSSPHTPEPASASVEQLEKEQALFEGPSVDERLQEETRIAQRFSRADTNIILWSGNTVWRVFRNPLALLLENLLACEANQGALLSLLTELDDLEPKTEVEFLGLTYVRQKASLLLFTALLPMPDPPDGLLRATEAALLRSDLDPRVALLAVPLVRDEVVQGTQGIWVFNGLARAAEPFIQGASLTQQQQQQQEEPDIKILHMLKRYLQSWQAKRGYASITDEDHVFDSADSALLQLLLVLDGRALASRDGPMHAALCADLYRAVDSWKGPFTRAVALLERHRRLFVLSRLYQSRKAARAVLATWTRIVVGELDAGGELNPAAADVQMRRYLVKLRDAALVAEYGAALAARNPRLGVAVFVDDGARVRFAPAEALALLEARAPQAVLPLLEHTVFVRREAGFANALVGRYLDVVLSGLKKKDTGRKQDGSGGGMMSEPLAQSYATYRVLAAPKPSYLSFIAHNYIPPGSGSTDDADAMDPATAWWRVRVRLLRLLGGDARSRFSADPADADPASLAALASAYDLDAAVARVEPFRTQLVSEAVILDGRRGRHAEALGLLVQGLGDYDTAVRYCLVGRGVASLAVMGDGDESEEQQQQQQEDLFPHLLREFLAIPDPSVRIERTTDLLSRFAPRFFALPDLPPSAVAAQTLANRQEHQHHHHHRLQSDRPGHPVLATLPPNWSVSVLSDYLTRLLRALRARAREARVRRALWAGVYLRVEVDGVEGVEVVGDGRIKGRSGDDLIKRLGAGEEEDDDGGGIGGAAVGAGEERGVIGWVQEEAESESELEEEAEAGAGQNGDGDVRRGRQRARGRAAADGSRIRVRLLRRGDRLPDTRRRRSEDGGADEDGRRGGRDTAPDTGTGIDNGNGTGVGSIEGATSVAGTARR